MKKGKVGILGVPLGYGAWQSGSEGTEETQCVHLNPVSGRWEPDLSRNQRHVNAAIFWHALRENGISDQVRGFGTLLREY